LHTHIKTCPREVLRRPNRLCCTISGEWPPQPVPLGLDGLSQEIHFLAVSRHCATPRAGMNSRAQISKSLRDSHSLQTGRTHDSALALASPFLHLRGRKVLKKSRALCCTISGEWPPQPVPLGLDGLSQEAHFVAVSRHCATPRAGMNSPAQISKSLRYSHGLQGGLLCDSTLALASPFLHLRGRMLGLDGRMW